MNINMSDNFSLVEGEWKDFIFKRIEPEDYQIVLDHVVKYFLIDEPTCALLGWSIEFQKEMCTAVTTMMDDGLSFYAVDKKSREVAGVRVTFSSKSVRLEEMEIKEVQTEAFLNGIDLKSEVKDELLDKWNADSYAEFFIASTHPHYRGQGLAMEMYLRSLSFLKAEGYGLIKCIFTSPTSRRAAFKLGFEPCGRVDYKDVVGKDGKFVFPQEKLTDEHYALAMIKTL